METTPTRILRQIQNPPESQISCSGGIARVPEAVAFGEEGVGGRSRRELVEGAVTGVPCRTTTGNDHQKKENYDHWYYYA